MFPVANQMAGPKYWLQGTHEYSRLLPISIKK